MATSMLADRRSADAAMHRSTGAEIAAVSAADDDSNVEAPSQDDLSITDVAQMKKFAESKTLIEAYSERIRGLPVVDAFEDFAEVQAGTTRLEEARSVWETLEERCRVAAERQDACDDIQEKVSQMDTGDIQHLRALTKAAIHRNLSTDDTDLIELAIHTLGAFDTLARLLMAERRYLLVLHARLDWESQRKRCWTKYLGLRRDLDSFITLSSRFSTMRGGEGNDATGTHTSTSPNTQKHAAFLQIEAAELARRCHSLLAQEIPAADRLLNDLMDQRQVPDALLDEQDRMDDFSELIKDKLVVITRLSRQWKWADRADELTKLLKKLNVDADPSQKSQKDVTRSAQAREEDAEKNDECNDASHISAGAPAIDNNKEIRPKETEIEPLAPSASVSAVQLSSSSSSSDKIQRSQDQTDDPVSNVPKSSKLEANLSLEDLSEQAEEAQPPVHTNPAEQQTLQPTSNDITSSPLSVQEKSASVYEPAVVEEDEMETERATVLDNPVNKDPFVFSDDAERSTSKECETKVSIPTTPLPAAPKTMSRPGAGQAVAPTLHPMAPPLLGTFELASTAGTVNLAGSTPRTRHATLNTPTRTAPKRTPQTARAKTPTASTQSQRHASTPSRTATDESRLSPTAVRTASLQTRSRLTSNASTYGPNRYRANPKSKLDVAVGKIVNRMAIPIAITHAASAKAPLRSSSPGSTSSGGRNSASGGRSEQWHDESGRYWLGHPNPKLCFCRILRSKTVMVRVGGGWEELSGYIDKHYAHLAANESVSVTTSPVQSPAKDGELPWLSSATLMRTPTKKLTNERTPSIAGSFGTPDQRFGLLPSNNSNNTLSTSSSISFPSPSQSTTMFSSTSDVTDQSLSPDAMMRRLWMRKDRQFEDGDAFGTRVTTSPKLHRQQGDRKLSESRRKASATQQRSRVLSNVN